MDKKVDRKFDNRYSSKSDKRNNNCKSIPVKEEAKPKSGSYPCPYFKACGGCDYIDMPYNEQLELKMKYVRQQLGDIAKAQNCKIEPIVGADNPLYYRNKVHSVFARNGRGQIVRGIYREETHKVVDVKGCLLEDRTADAIIEEVKRLLPSFKLKVYDEDTGYGWLRHVLVRVANQTVLSADTDSAEKPVQPEYMVVLVTAEVPFPGKNNFVKALRTKFPCITTIVQNINDKRTSMVLGERNITLYGKGFVEDSTLGLKFRISPSAFFQINSQQTGKLYKLALEMAELKGNEVVLDAYCGTGTIGMFMSAQAKHVVGVELNRDAVRDAISNAKANGIDNILFVNDDATKYMQRVAADEKVHFDVLCMDPPRSGSTPEFISAVAGLNIPKVVYVSCNPETLARDLMSFTKKGYKIVRIVPADMFPGTKHTEVVCEIVKR